MFHKWKKQNQNVVWWNYWIKITLKLIWFNHDDIDLLKRIYRATFQYLLNLELNNYKFLTRAIELVGKL